MFLATALTIGYLSLAYIPGETLRYGVALSFFEPGCPISF